MRILLLITLLLAGLHAGFFFAWSFTVMNGLDAAAPEVAIQAMQAMNANVRNAPFAVVFFGAPLAAAISTGALLIAGQRRRGLVALLGLAGLAATVGITAGLHVPWNEALAVAVVPGTDDAAAGLWQDYSDPWTAWNHLRFATSLAGTAFLAIAFAMRG